MIIEMPSGMFTHENLDEQWRIIWKCPRCHNEYASYFGGHNLHHERDCLAIAWDKIRELVEVVNELSGAKR